MSQWWLWSYVALMLGGALWFVGWSRDPKGLPQASYRVVIAILLWSAAWHVVVALGSGETEVDGYVVHWARYGDWVVTVPLLLVALALTATHALPDKRRGLVVVMIVAGVPMILAGLAAELTSQWSRRIAFYALGMLALGVLYGVVWGPLRATAKRQPRPMARLYTIAALLLSVLWIAFPAAWILGPAGIGLFDELTDAALILALSALMKLGWSLFDVGRLRVLSGRGEAAIG